jgi:hypothetical protein
MRIRLLASLALIVTALLGAAVAADQANQTSGVSPQPDLTGVVYYLDPSSQTLKPLKLEDTTSTHISASPFSGKANSSLKIPGRASSFRIDTDTRPAFISRCGEVDHIKLYPMIVSRNERGCQTNKGKGVNTFAYWGLDMRITRYGDSYKLVPRDPLEPGEYILMTNERAFSFGLGPVGK